MSKTVNVSLTFEQLDVLRGVLYEYYTKNPALEETEEQIRLELEDILADAEDEIYTS